MSGEINVVSRTQVIIVDAASQSVSIINAGPSGPGGPPGIGGTYVAVGDTPPPDPDVDDLWVDTGDSGGFDTVVTHFSVSIPPTAEVGEEIMVTVSALNAENVIVPGYTGTVTFDEVVSPGLGGVAFWLDTDFGGDSDDIFDLAAFLQFQLENAFLILGISASQNMPKVPGAIKACCVHMGLPSIEVSVTKEDTSAWDVNDYADGVYDDYPHTGVGLASTVPDMIGKLRTAMADPANAGMLVLVNGPATGMAAFLAAPGDGISSLNSIDLVTACGAVLIWVAGCVFHPYVSSVPMPDPYTGGVSDSSNAGLGIWTDTGEFNMAADPVASAYLAANWPGEIISVSIHLGNQMVTGKTIATDLPGTCPFVSAYKDWADAHPPAYGTPYNGGRMPWTQPGADCKVNPDDWAYDIGTISVNSGTGVMTWTSNPSGPHKMLLRRQRIPVLEARYDALILDHGV